MLDVNMGVPLTDEAELLATAIKLVQSLTDLPLCIDSSVVEALDAGLAAYDGKALVNSVTGEKERLDADPSPREAVRRGGDRPPERGGGDPGGRPSGIELVPQDHRHRLRHLRDPPRRTS